jgi:Clp protease
VLISDQDFRPNPSRAVFVTGNIDQNLIDRLTPRIVSLQNQSRDPISVYIDSRGGIVASADLLLSLLTASNQDSAPPCRVITVVTSRASSAAATCLRWGNFALTTEDKEELEKVPSKDRDARADIREGRRVHVDPEPPPQRTRLASVVSDNHL